MLKQKCLAVQFIYWSISFKADLLTLFGFGLIFVHLFWCPLSLTVCCFTCMHCLPQCLSSTIIRILHKDIRLVWDHTGLVGQQSNLWTTCLHHLCLSMFTISNSVCCWLLWINYSYPEWSWIVAWARQLEKSTLGVSTSKSKMTITRVKHNI